MELQFQEERRIMMNKILLKINKEDELKYPVSGYILGINKFSYLFEKTYSISEIKEIKNNNLDKEIFVSFNKIIFNNELDDYKSMLEEIDEIGVNGIIVGDIAALTYNLKTNIILDQLHLNNSYYTLNHYENNDVKGFVLTNDITKEEINEIRENTKSLLFKQVFGYPHLSTSKRLLISNYLKHFDIESTEYVYQISEKNSDNYYKIIEDEFGTHILGSNPLNLLGINLDVDYYIIDSYLLSDIKDVITIFINNDINKKDLIDNTYSANDGFINKETIYKVKNDEK